MKSYKPHVSSVGDAAANIIAAACYLFVLLFWSFGIIPILIIFLVEKKSGLVRFHAMQAILMWLLRLMMGGGMPFEALAAVLTGDVGYLNVAGGWAGSDLPTIAIRMGVGAVIGVLCIIAAAQAYYWRDWKVPVVGLVARLVVNHCRPTVYNAEATVPRVCEIGYTDEHKPEWTPAWMRDPDYDPRRTAPEPELPVEREPEPPETVIEEVEEPQAESSPLDEEAAPSHRLPAWLRRFEETVREAQALDIGIDAGADANDQLPPEMRDPPTSREIAAAEQRQPDDALPEEEEKEEEFEEPVPVQRRIVELAVAEERPPDELDAEEEFERSMEESERPSILKRLLGRITGANRALAPPEQKGDPNGQVPLEMRDPPAPSDMF